MYGHRNPTIRKTDDGEIVDPKMHAAVSLVASRGPYASKNDLATSVGPNGSQQYGYNIVNRCLSKGPLALDSDHAEASPRGQGAVTMTQKGARYLRTQEQN